MWPCSNSLQPARFRLLVCSSCMKKISCFLGQGGKVHVVTSSAVGPLCTYKPPSVAETNSSRRLHLHHHEPSLSQKEIHSRHHRVRQLQCSRDPWQRRHSTKTRTKDEHHIYYCAWPECSTHRTQPEENSGKSIKSTESTVRDTLHAKRVSAPRLPKLAWPAVAHEAESNTRFTGAPRKGSVA